MPQNRTHYHVSSAVVATLPFSTESHPFGTRRNGECRSSWSRNAGGKIVVVIEGTSTRACSASASRISHLDGVLAANMVFEHVETEEMSDDTEH